GKTMERAAEARRDRARGAAHVSPLGSPARCDGGEDHEGIRSQATARSRTHSPTRIRARATGREGMNEDLYERTTEREGMGMCTVAVLAIKAHRPDGITLQELNEYLAACRMQQLKDHNDWIGLMEHQWEFRHGWDGSLTDEGRLNGPWP